MKSPYDISQAEILRDKELFGDDPNKIDRSEFKGITKEGFYQIGDEYFDNTPIKPTPEKPASVQFLRMIDALAYAFARVRRRQQRKDSKK